MAGVDSASWRARTEMPARSRTSALVRSRTSHGRLSYEAPPANSASRRVTGITGSPGASAGGHHATGEACAGVAGGLGLVVVGIGVDDDRAADDARRSRGHGEPVDHGLDPGAPGLVRRERRQVAGVALGAGRMAVRLAVRIEVAAGAHAVARAAVALLV